MSLPNFTLNIAALHRFAILLLTAATISSCTHSLYVPPEPNLLVLSESGDLKASAGAGVLESDELNFHLQAGYSPIEHLGLSISYFQVGMTRAERDFGNQSSFYDFSRRFNVYDVEGAIGTYLTKTIMTKTHKKGEGAVDLPNSLTFDAYLGYGQIKSRRSYFNGGLTTIEGRRFFLQGGIHYQGSFLGLSYTLRGVWLDYTSGKVFGRISEQSLEDLAAINVYDPYTFIESSIRFRAGNEKFRGFVSRNWMSSPFGDKQLDYTPASWHLGFILGLNELLNIKKKEPKKKKRPKRGKRRG